MVYVIIGVGMIGLVVVCYLVEVGYDVILIGLSEFDDKFKYSGVFVSYYDVG